tara:strand:+ start:117 stop:413 length:297 start_codon:yes stop_codon:yes gene_type:complete
MNKAQQQSVLEIAKRLDGIEKNIVEIHGSLWGSDGLAHSPYGKTTLRARIGIQTQEQINDLYLDLLNKLPSKWFLTLEVAIPVLVGMLIGALGIYFIA